MPIKLLNIISTVIKVSCILLALFCFQSCGSHESFFQSELEKHDVFLNKSCKNIVLLKKKDCISCEMSLAKFMKDSLLFSKTIFVSEYIRPIEKKDFLSERQYLTSSNTIFNDALLKAFEKEIKRTLKTSIIVVLNEQNEITFHDTFRDLMAKPNHIDLVCR